MSTTAPYASSATSPPLARRAVVPLMLVQIALSGLIIFAPIVLLASGGGTAAPHRIYEHFREGGWGMWLITLLQMVLALASAAVGALMIRGNRIPAAILFVFALGPFTVGLLGTLTGHRMIMGAISGASVDASQRARIYAQGISEVSNLSVYGGIGAAFAMYLAGLAAALSLVTIDPAPLGPPPPSNAWIAGPIAGVAAAIVAVAARIALHIPALGLDVLIVFGLLTVGLLAGLVSRPLPALVAARNDDEAGPAWRVLLVAAFAFAAAMIFLDRAAAASTLRAVLGAMSGQSVDPSQRTRLLMEILPAIHGRPIVMILDAAGCLAAFSAPLVAGLAAKKKISIAVVLAAVSAALVAGLAMLTGSRIEGSISEQHEAVAGAERSLAAHGVALPVSRRLERSLSLSGTPDFSVKRDGTVSDDRSQLAREDPYGRGTIAVASDGALPFELFTTKLIPAVAKAVTARGLGLVIAPAERRDHSELGPYAGLLGSDLQMIELRFDDKLGDGLPARSDTDASGGYRDPSDSHFGAALGLLVDADRARLVSFPGASPAAGLPLVETLPIDDSAAAETERSRFFVAFKRAHPDLGTVVLAPLPGDPMARVTALLGSLGASLDNSNVDLMITADRAALERMTTNTAGATKPSSGGVRFSDLTVSGRLAPEEITRVLRRNYGFFTLCHHVRGTSAETYPPSEVALRFVIDRTGSPSSLTVTPRPIPDVATCLDRSVRSLSFPPPESGIVVVNVKLTLQ
jgi:hypothetical protein